MFISSTATYMQRRDDSTTLDRVVPSETTGWGSRVSSQKSVIFYVVRVSITHVNRPVSQRYGRQYIRLTTKHFFKPDYKTCE